MLLKFSFWLFRVIKLLFSSFISSRFRTSLIFKIRFPSILIWFFMLLLAFLHFEVMVLFIIWSYSAFVYMQIFVVISAKVTVLYDDFKRMSSCIFSWKRFLIFLNLMFCTNAKGWGPLLALVYTNLFLWSLFTLSFDNCFDLSCNTYVLFSVVFLCSSLNIQKIWLTSLSQ